MASAETLRNRPWLASGIAAALLAVVLLVVPFSYQRTTGHRVALTLSGASDAAQVRAIAAQLKSALRANQLGVRAESTNGGVAWTLEGSVPASARIDVAAVAHAFAKGLTERGYRAAVVFTPVVERVSGSVYAFARDLVIQVGTEGKSASQIEAEIRQRLAEAGIANAQVSVTDGADGRKITLDVKRETRPGEAQEPGDVSVQLTKGGKPLGDDGVMVRQELLKTPTGVTLHLVVSDAGKRAEFDVPDAKSLSDTALASAIDARLGQAGMHLAVTVHDGRIEIEERK